MKPLNIEVTRFTSVSNRQNLISCWVESSFKNLRMKEFTMITICGNVLFGYSISGIVGGKETFCGRRRHLASMETSIFKTKRNMVYIFLLSSAGRKMFLPWGTQFGKQAAFKNMKYLTSRKIKYSTSTKLLDLDSKILPPAGSPDCNDHPKCEYKPHLMIL